MPHPSIPENGAHLLGSIIDEGRLELVAILGYGAYGVVYKACDTREKLETFRRKVDFPQFAVKTQIRAGLDSRQRLFQQREIALHRMVSSHPNIVSVHKVIESHGYLFVIMDFCEDGDLFGMITEKQRYIGNDRLIRDVFLQIVDAIDHCHQAGIYHRDLKPENILCKDGGRKVCIADFGLATSEKFSKDFGCGSTFYMSPECQGGLKKQIDGYSTGANDIWSLGVILVNLTCGRNPWQQARTSDETFRAFLLNKGFLRTILPISHELNDVLCRIFDINPDRRITLPELRKAIKSISRFTMTDTELYHAHEAAQQAAAAARPRAQPQVIRDSGYQADLSGSSDYQIAVERVEAHQLVSPPFDNTAFDAPLTPLLVTRSRSSSGDDENGLLITPPQPPAVGEPIAEANFELDDGPRHAENPNLNRPKLNIQTENLASGISRTRPGARYAM